MAMSDDHSRKRRPVGMSRWGSIGDSTRHSVYIVDCGLAHRAPYPGIVPMHVLLPDTSVGVVLPHQDGHCVWNTELHGA